MATTVQLTGQFSSKALRAFIIPLFCEQFLVMLVGIADTLIVSYAGEAAVSGVSLVNQFNTTFIYLFSALASGGGCHQSIYRPQRTREQYKECQSAAAFLGFVLSVFSCFGADWKHFDSSASVWAGRGRCYASLCHLFTDFSVFLSVFSHL